MDSLSTVATTFVEGRICFCHTHTHLATVLFRSDEQVPCLYLCSRLHEKKDLCKFQSTKLFSCISSKGGDEIMKFESCRLFRLKFLSVNNRKVLSCPERRDVERRQRRRRRRQRRGHGWRRFSTCTIEVVSRLLFNCNILLLFTTNGGCVRVCISVQQHKCFTNDWSISVEADGGGGGRLSQP